MKNVLYHPDLHHANSLKEKNFPEFNLRNNNNKNLFAI